jgi:UDP-N-acetylglucosamine 1-carboxyvinyltransferase
MTPPAHPPKSFTAEKGRLLTATPLDTNASWVVDPVGPLSGSVRVRGSKNAVTKHMVASLLGSSPSTLLNTPHVGEVDITADMIRALGADIHIDRDGDSITIDPTGFTGGRVPLSFSGRNRIPILMLAPALHRTGEGFVPLAGGDRIGARPLDFHIEALRAMGATVTQTDEGIEAHIAGRLQGTQFRLPFPSVMATETLLLAAVLAEGRTLIDNAAQEPEVVELALFLQRMGARIELRPDRRIIVEGVDKLSSATHTLSGDRIEAFSYLVAGLVTGGQVTVEGCTQGRLVTAISTLYRMGVEFDITDDSISARAGAGKLQPAVVSTDTHPGFMTDWQSPMLVLFTQAEGMSVLHETVFENRLGYVSGLQQMGAEIAVFDSCLGGPSCRFFERNAKHSAVVHGISKLHGAEVTIPDIRAGFSYVIAAAAAEGTTTVHDVYHLERGYHRPIENLSNLGMQIRRVT